MNGPTRRPTAPAPKLPSLKLPWRHGTGVPLLLALSGWVVLSIVAAGAPVAVRAVAVFAFTLVCPGIAVTRLLPVRDLLERVVLAVALGMSFGALVAETADLSRPAPPSAILTVLASACTVAAVAELVRKARTKP